METKVLENKSNAEKIWNEIKNKKINVFGTVEKITKFLSKIDLPGDELYVKLTASAALPALEATLGKKYVIEGAERYTVIKYKDEKSMKLNDILNKLDKKNV